MDEKDFVFYKKPIIMHLNDIRRKFRKEESTVYYEQIKDDIYAITAEFYNPIDFDTIWFYDFLEEKKEKNEIIDSSSLYLNRIMTGKIKNKYTYIKRIYN